MEPCDFEAPRAWLLLHWRASAYVFSVAICFQAPNVSFSVASANASVEILFYSLGKQNLNQGIKPPSSPPEFLLSCFSIFLWSWVRRYFSWAVLKWNYLKLKNSLFNSVAAKSWWKKKSNIDFRTSLGINPNEWGWKGVSILSANRSTRW